MSAFRIATYELLVLTRIVTEAPKGFPQARVGFERNRITTEVLQTGNTLIFLSTTFFRQFLKVVPESPTVAMMAAVRHCHNFLKSVSKNS